MMNITETDSYLIYKALDNLDNDKLVNSVVNVSEKIPNKNIVEDLINDTENKNWKEYIGYDNYVYHTKYDKYDNQYKYNDEKYNFLYLKCCGFLLDEIEKMIKEIVNCENNVMYCKKQYTKIDFCTIDQTSFIRNNNKTKFEFLNDVLLKWDNEKKVYPFNFVKNIIEQKGYEFDISENSDYYELTLKINEKRE